MLEIRLTYTYTTLNQSLAEIEFKLFMRTFFVFFLLFCQFSLLAQSSVSLRYPPKTPHGNYIKELLEEAYKQLGYEVNYLNVPGARELSLTEKSVLSGVLARDIVIEQSSPTLLKVDVSLFSYKVLLITNSNVCGTCSLDKIQVIAFPRGGKIYEKFLNDLPEHINKIAIGGTTSIVQMLNKNRIDGFITSDTNINAKILIKPNLTAKTLETRYDFHYLSPQAVHLKKPLETKLKQMLGNGRMAELKAKYNIQ